METTEGVDGVLLALGGYSRYQIFHFSLMLISDFSADFQLLNMVFIGQNIPHQCASPPEGTNFTIDDIELPLNSNITYHKCSIDIFHSTDNGSHLQTLPCVYGMQYSDRKDASFVSEFDLVCEREALSDLPQTLLILGQALGALTLPYFSDRYGRKPVQVISHSMLMVIGIAIAFSPNYLVFAILRLLIGAVQQGVVLTQATYRMEVFPAKYRRIVCLVGGFMWTISASLLTGIGYWMRFENWRHLQLLYTSIALQVIIQFFFLDESFRWLMRNGKYKLALKNIKKAIRMSGANQELVLEAFHKAVEDSADIQGDGLLSNRDSNKTKQNNPTLLDMFRRKRIAKNTVIIWFMWCTAAMCFFGLFFTSTSLSGDPYLNVFLNTLMGVPATIIFWSVIDRIGRKKTGMTFFLFGGIFLLLATIIHTTTSGDISSALRTTFNLLGKIGAEGAFSVCFFYTPELYPTNLRNIGLGSASVAARTGGMIAPFSRLMIQYVPWGPGAIFSVFSLVAAFLVTFLPETRGKQLPQTMADLRLLYLKKKSKTVEAVEEQPL